MSMCSICHDELTDPAILSCDHSFCTHCIKNWENNTCPLCRADTNHFYTPPTTPTTPSYSSLGYLTPVLYSFPYNNLPLSNPFNLSSLLIIPPQQPPQNYTITNSNGFTLTIYGVNNLSQNLTINLGT